MIIHLDTNFLIGAQKPGTVPNQKFLEWLACGDLFEISVLVWAEFLCGSLTHEEEASARLLISAQHPMSDGQAELGAKLFRETGRRKRSLADCLIAACAILADAPLATENRTDFEKLVPLGLRLA
ncbi:MAG: PIN domain-containing protein [Verrucomicrobiaceae bacterium]|nr:PIN domain-containing protein [Verrucomicrobiaceae bacterium]